MECFFSREHAAVRVVRFAPDGGALRPVAACGACAAAIEAGRVPEGFVRERAELPEPRWHTGTSRGSTGWGFLPRLFGLFDDLV